MHIADFWSGPIEAKHESDEKSEDWIDIVHFILLKIRSLGINGRRV